MTIAQMREPPTAPTGAMAANSPIARFRFFPDGNVIPSSATMFGITSPPPMPHRARKMHRAIRLLAKPPASAQTTHHAHPAVKIDL